MNDTVTATGMSVTAKADQIFLEILAGTKTATEIQTAKKIQDNATLASAQLFPAAHTAAADKISTIEAASGDPAILTNWYYKTSNDPNLYGGTGVESEALDIKSTDMGKYVLINEFSITVAAGSNAVSGLKVKDCTITTDGDRAVKVLVASSSAAEEFGIADAATSTTVAGSTTLRSTNLTSSDVETIKIYIYWDGNDTDVYTNGIADLKNTSVTVTFTGTLVPTV